MLDPSADTARITSCESCCAATSRHNLKRALNKRFWVHFFLFFLLGILGWKLLAASQSLILKPCRSLVPSPNAPLLAQTPLASQLPRKLLPSPAPSPALSTNQTAEGSQDKSATIRATYGEHAAEGG